YLNNLGVAQYRVGRFPEALATLRRSDEMYSKMAKRSRPADLAFLAMTQYQLGKKAGTRPIAQLAHDHDVSRKFVYQQAAKAENALDNAFTTPDPDADQVLFHLPVTKAWLQQLTLGLILICHCSYRGVVELCRDLFDSALSV